MLASARMSERPALNALPDPARAKRRTCRETLAPQNESCASKALRPAPCALRHSRSIRLSRLCSARAFGNSTRCQAELR